MEEGAARGDMRRKRSFFLHLFYFILFYVAPYFVYTSAVVVLVGFPSVRKQRRRGRRFVKFLRSLIARLLAMQRERRAYYQLG